MTENSEHITIETDSGWFPIDLNKTQNSMFDFTRLNFNGSAEGLYDCDLNGEPIAPLKDDRVEELEQEQKQLKPITEEPNNDSQ